MTDLAIIALAGSAVTDRPWVITSTGVRQLSSGEVPNPWVAAQTSTRTALFAAGLGGVIGAFLAQALDPTATYQGAYRAVSSYPSVVSGWTAPVVDTSYQLLDTCDSFGAQTLLAPRGGFVDRLVVTAPAGVLTVTDFRTSTDAGQSFTVMTPPGASGGSVGVGRWIRKDRVLAFVQTVVANWNGGKYSIDGGMTWTALGRTTGPTINDQIVDLDYDGTVFHLLTLQPGGTYTFWTSTDATNWTNRQTWAGTVAVLDAPQRISVTPGGYTFLWVYKLTGGHTLHRASTASIASANPFASILTVSGGLSPWPSCITAIGSALFWITGNTVYRSTDSGATWGSWGATTLCANQITVLPQSVTYQPTSILRGRLLLGRNRGQLA